MSNPKKLQDYSSLIGQRVEIYWNLHKHCFSVRKDGRVVCHVVRAFVDSPEFVVRKTGREKVLRDKRKNVHAFVRGILWSLDDLRMDLLNSVEAIPVSYDPYKNESFVMRSGLPIFSAYCCYLKTLETVEIMGKPIRKPRLYI
jgi:hypothetical protein